MRGLSLLDVLVVLAVAALLLFAATRDFSRYESRTLPASPAATPQPEK